MTKPWDLVEDEARRLLSNGMTLERLREELSHKRGFNASTRAWRNKISNWGIKKDRPKESLPRSKRPHCVIEPDKRQRGPAVRDGAPSSRVTMVSTEPSVDTLLARIANGSDEPVRRGLDRSARVPRHRALVDRILSPTLDIQSGCDLLERGLLKDKEPHEVNSTCREIVEIGIEVVAYQSYYDLTRFFSLVGYICLTYPAFLSDAGDDKDWYFKTFQELVVRAYRPGDLQPGVTDTYNVSLRLFLRVGFEVDTNGFFPYTITRFEELPGIASYTYVRACVETCDVETCGRDLFKCLATLFAKQPWSDSGPEDEEFSEDGGGDGFALWTKSGSSKLADLLQILVGRVLQQSHAHEVNPLSFVLRHMPDACMPQKVQLLKSILKKHSPMVKCSKYGHPLDLLARTPEPSSWRFAEILFSEETLIRLLGSQPLLEKPTFSGIAKMPRFGHYTRFADQLQRCVLHVLTRNALRKLSVLPGDSHTRLVEILSIRRAYQLPELNVTLSSDGILGLADDDDSGP